MITLDQSLIESLRSTCNHWSIWLCQRYHLSSIYICSTLHHFDIINLRDKDVIHTMCYLNTSSWVHCTTPSLVLREHSWLTSHNHLEANEIMHLMSRHLNDSRVHTPPVQQWADPSFCRPKARLKGTRSHHDDVCHCWKTCSWGHAERVKIQQHNFRISFRKHGLQWTDLAMAAILTFCGNVHSWPYLGASQHVSTTTYFVRDATISPKGPGVRRWQWRSAAICEPTPPEKPEPGLQSILRVSRRGRGRHPWDEIGTAQTEPRWHRRCHHQC